MSQMMTDAPSMMQRMWSGGGMATAGAPWSTRRDGGCGCGCGGTSRHGDGCGCGCGNRQDCTCHCECCVCDADVLVHARCGELRRIPLTFENDTRRDKPVVLTLEKFVSSGGRDLGWAARLSETQFTLHPCDEHTVTLLVQIRCNGDKLSTPGTPSTPSPQSPPSAPAPGENPNTPGAGTNIGSVNTGATRDDLFGMVDRCEVAYATIRAEGCLTRPIVVAVAVLPDDCDAFRSPCGCGCCND
jgi:hypothetical protein